MKRTFKTIQAHIDRIQRGRFQKNEINALTKLFASHRWATDERKAEIATLQSRTMDYAGTVYIERFGEEFECQALHFRKFAKITEEQTRFGKTWLKERYIKLNGEPRKCAANLSAIQLQIVRAVSRFEFVGILLCYRIQYGRICNDVLPIYRTYNRQGDYFDYSPVHWGEPVIMVGIQSRLSLVGGA